MVAAAEFGTGQGLWDMLWFFMFLIWIWLLIIVFTDIFRSRDLSGWGKALWTIFVILIPYIGVLVYMIARGHKMHEHAEDDARQQDAAMKQYIQSAVQSDGQGSKSAADEVARLADLRKQGVLTEEEFQTAKAKALA